MKIFVEIDTEKNTIEECTTLIRHLFNKNDNPGQQKLETATNDNKNEISIVIRDGKEKTTESVKDDLKRLGFNYYKYKKNSKIEDPRWTQTCNKNYWDEIKNHSSVQNLNIWTSDNGGGSA